MSWEEAQERWYSLDGQPLVHLISTSKPSRCVFNGQMRI